MEFATLPAFRDESLECLLGLRTVLSASMMRDLTEYVTIARLDLARPAPPLATDDDWREWIAQLDGTDET